jgi:hypothetical protein
LKYGFDRTIADLFEPSQQIGVSRWVSRHLRQQSRLGSGDGLEISGRQMRITKCHGSNCGICVTSHDR